MRFPGKILLFGEYSVLRGGSALAIPSGQFYGEWSTDIKPQQALIDFIDFLGKKKFEFLNPVVSTTWEKGYWCNIPIGYGLGSSGSITAALYHELRINQTNNLEHIKKELAEMESFFHGESSGLDPLVSLINKPIHIQDGQLSTLDQDIKTDGLFLIDSLQPRSTKPFVAHFHELMKETEFSQMIDSQLIPLNNQCTNTLLNQKFVDTEVWKEISKLQLKYFSYMIPDRIKTVWEEGLRTGLYSCKLCGAGGGGMFLALGQSEAVKEFRTFPI